VETLEVRTGINEDRIIQGMVGRSLEARYPDRSTEIGEVFFEVSDWTVQHPTAPERLVVKHASMNVRRGEVVGIAGLMGAGRTEFARSIFGRSYGTYLCGTIVKDGRQIDLPDVASAIRAGLAYVSEDRKVLGLNLLDSIKRSIVSAKLPKIARRGVIDEDAEVRVSEEYRRALRIKTPSVETGVATLSGGNQQKVVLAKWMFTDPDLLILDEPTRGIDVGAKYEIYTIINQLAASGKGVIVISSELPELLGISDRIYTVFEGSFTDCLPADQATPETLMRSMTSLTRKANAA
jgi:putative multiple sugar transport system ATP-binding protein